MTETLKTVKQLQSEETKKRIVAAATRPFIANGYFGTWIADLAEETGLTKGALYHHYKNKEALVLAIVKSVRGQGR